MRLRARGCGGLPFSAQRSNRQALGRSLGEGVPLWKPGLSLSQKEQVSGLTETSAQLMLNT